MLHNRIRLWQSRMSMLVVVGLLLSLGSALVYADGPTPRVFAPDSRPYGTKYDEWTAKWWQWAWSMPTTHSPLVDTADCGTEQSGPVWFLAGSADGQPKTRTCSVPADKALLFALINAECSDVEEPPFYGKNPSKRRACVTPFIDGVGVSTLKVTVDGVDVNNLEDFRFVSPDFSFSIPAHDPFFAVTPPGVRSGKSTSDGYWLMLKPLSPGPHVLHIEASMVSGPGAGFSQDVTYNLNVGGHD